MRSAACLPRRRPQAAGAVAHQLRPAATGKLLETEECVPQLHY